MRVRNGFQQIVRQVEPLQLRRAVLKRVCVYICYHVTGQIEILQHKQIVESPGR